MSAYLLCTVLFASQVEWLYCEGNKLLAVKLLLQVWQACLNSIRMEKLVVSTITVTCRMENQHLSVDTVVDFLVLPVLRLNANVKMKKNMILCSTVAHGAISYHMNAVMFQTFVHCRAYLIFFFFHNILNKNSSEQNNRVFFGIRLSNVNASYQVQHNTEMLDSKYISVVFKRVVFNKNDDV
jgi:hypothetical protein